MKSKMVIKNFSIGIYFLRKDLKKIIPLQFSVFLVVLFYFVILHKNSATAKKPFENRPHKEIMKPFKFAPKPSSLST